MIRIPQHRHARNLRHRLLQKLEDFARQLVVDQRNPRHVSAGSSDARHQSALHRIVADQCYDRNRIRGVLGVRRDVAAIGKDQIGFELHQFCGERRKTLAFAVGVPVFDLDGFSIDVTERLQALNQGGDGVDLR